MHCIPMARCANMQAADNSASPELSAMVLWSLLQLCKRGFPNLIFPDDTQLHPVTVTLNS